MPPYEVGSVWFFFGANRYIIGRVKAVTPFEVILEDASWVPDTGRMYDSLLAGNFKEVEPFPASTCVLSRFAIHDATPCGFEPPKKQK